MEDEGKPAQRRVWREWEGWAACVFGAATPTAMLASLVQMIEGKTAPWFVPGLFIGVFTVAVLAIRPWTAR